MARPIGITISHNKDTGFDRGFMLNLEPPDWKGYTHEIRDMGGFYAAAFILVQPRDTLEEFFERGLDREVRVVGQRGATLWEGYVDEMAYTIRGVELRKSLSRMANRVWGRYSSGGVSGVRSTPQNDAISQARYGVKERPYSFGQAVSAGQADQVAKVILSRTKSPDNPSISIGGGDPGAPPTLTLRCAGWWQKFFWRVYNNAGGVGNIAAYSLVDAILDSMQPSAVINYALNPSAEVNHTDDWLSTYGSGADASAKVSRDTTKAILGLASFKLTAGAAAVVRHTSVAGVSVPTGATVAVSGWQWCGADPTGNKGGLSIVTVPEATLAIAYPVTSGGWERLTAAWTNTGAAVTVYARIRNGFNDGVTEVWGDTIQLELGELTLYTDGTLPQCGWSGAAHNSTSWRRPTFAFDSRVVDRNDTQVQAKLDADQWPGDLITSVSKLGDANFDRWVGGIWENRQFRWQRAAASRLQVSA